MKELEVYKNYESHCHGAKIVQGQPDTWKLMCSECYQYCDIKLKLNERGKKFYLNMENAYPGFTDAVAMSLFVEQLRATPLPARVKKKIMKEIRRVRLRRIKEYIQLKGKRGNRNKCQQ